MGSNGQAGTTTTKTHQSYYSVSMWPRAGTNQTIFLLKEGIMNFIECLNDIGRL